MPMKADSVRQKWDQWLAAAIADEYRISSEVMESDLDNGGKQLCILIILGR